MDPLWAPWRSKYIESFKDEPDDPEKKECFFCDAVARPEADEETLVVARREKCFVIMNRFPYNGGHLLVAPFRHVGGLIDLDDEELFEITETTRDAIEVIKKISSPDAFNIGANVGRVSGAGYPGHVHYHVVPRWNGDTSFMSVLFDVKVVSQALRDGREALANGFEEYYAARKK